ncbi:MAG: NADH-quinone oxidoreductase subunit M [Acidimicrobiales bacterium]|nr:NADH-quinone oxidoreductase subunit M [Acidimicrobiales bacterium]
MDFTSGQFWTSPITYMVFVPVVGALVMLLVPKANETAHKVLALVTSLVTAAIGISILTAFNYDSAGELQGVVNTDWIPFINANWIVGVDGISLPMIALTLLIVPLCVVYSWDHIPSPGNAKAFLILILVLDTGMLGSFVAQDLILFFVFFEVVLLPMYFMIGVWGGENRQYASIKFFLYTLFGSALMIVAFISLYFLSGAETFSMIELPGLAQSITHGWQLVIFGGMLIGFGIKVPMFPVHTWLPDAHTQAPTVGSVILAAVLLKLGTYGFIRIAIPILPEAARSYQWLIGLLAVIGIIYGALCCLAQTDMKRLIAFSSVAHMGYVMLAIATLTTFGINAAIFGMVAHGLITGMLFFVAGSTKERYHTLEIKRLGGLLKQAPRMGWILGLATMASLGLPGLAGFWGEFPAILSAYDPTNADYSTGFFGVSNLVLFRVFMVVAAIGTVFAAGYLLFLFQRVAFGVPSEEFEHEPIPDVNRFEWIAWVPMLVLIVVLGVYPNLIFSVTDSTVAPMMQLAAGG